MTIVMRGRKAYEILSDLIALFPSLSPTLSLTISFGLISMEHYFAIGYNQFVTIEKRQSTFSCLSAKVKRQNYFFLKMQIKKMKNFY